MANEAHTVGPWSIAPALNDDRIGIYDEGGYRVASVHDFNKLPQNKANAALIASAPELLAAMQQAISLADANCSKREDGTYDRSAKCQASYDRCVAAIAAATNGGAQ